MAPYETLFGRKCRSPICWTKVGDRKLLDPRIETKSNSFNSEVGLGSVGPGTIG
ncbi:hypothetical protein ACSBR1_017163 [Camellia fascicularis]